MADPIESPEVFWAHLCSHVTRYDAKHGLDFVLPLIRARDAAVRRGAPREAVDTMARFADKLKTKRFYAESNGAFSAIPDVRALAGGSDG